MFYLEYKASVDQAALFQDWTVIKPATKFKLLFRHRH